jgi:hypothetical protein
MRNYISGVMMLPRSVTFIAAALTVVFTQLDLGQAAWSLVPSSRARTVPAQSKLHTRFELEGPLSLQLTRCIGHLDIPSLGFRAGVIDIQGKDLTLTDEGGTSVKGEALAYALSQYRIIASVTFVLGRSGNSVVSPEWRAPTIISLRLTQDKRNGNHFTVSPVMGSGHSFAPTRIRCQNADAESALR